MVPPRLTKQIKPVVKFTLKVVLLNNAGLIMGWDTLCSITIKNTRRISHKPKRRENE